MSIRVCPVVKDTDHNPLFGEESFADPPKPWEARFDNGYPMVVNDTKAGLLRLYYTIFSTDEHSTNTPLSERPHTLYRPTSGRVTSLAYAESDDGIHWRKPNLGIVEFEGSTDNNLLLNVAHGSGVLLDEADPDPTRRFKLLTKMEYGPDNAFMAVAFSEDGIHFSTPRPWPVHNPEADTHNFVFRDPLSDCFVLITRIWKDGLRICAMSTSDDFLHWSEPTEILRGAGAANQIYSMPVFPYAGQYFGLASVFHDGDRSAADFDLVDCVLTSARSLDSWEWVSGFDPVIERGSGRYPEGAFDSSCIYAAPPVEHDGKLWVYYMGGNGRHTDFRETFLARGSWEPDRFAAYVPTNPDRPGVLTTGPFSIHGDHVSVLVDVSEGGALRYAVVLDSATRETLPGYGFDDCLPLTGRGWQDLSFHGRRLFDVGRSAVVLAFEVHQAELFAVSGDLHHRRHTSSHNASQVNSANNPRQIQN